MLKLRPWLLLLAPAIALLAGCAGPAPTIGSVPRVQNRFAAYGTNQVHYQMEGSGPQDVVLVHCWAGNLGFWRDQTRALAGKARVISIDLPGHGQSDKPQAAYTMDFFAGAVLAVMRDAHSPRATLIGHSMGVPVICRVYQKEPSRVAALVSVDGFMRKPKMEADQAELFIAPFRAPGYRDYTRDFMASMFPVPGTDALRDRVLTELLETPQYVMVSAMEGMFSATQPDWDPGKLDIPVFSIHTTNPMWTEDYQRYVKGLSPRAEYQTMAATGHWLMMERPGEFNLALTDFLQRQGLIAK